MAFDTNRGDELSLGALANYHTTIGSIGAMLTNLTHGMGLAVINVAQVGALTGAGMLIRQSDPGYMSALRTAKIVPEADKP